MNRAPTSVVSAAKLFIAAYVPEDKYQHRNAKSDHRFNRSGDGNAPRYPNGNVKDYCSKEPFYRRFDVERYRKVNRMVAVCNSVLSVPEETKRRVAYEKNWKHLGLEGSQYPVHQAADVPYSRTLEEHGYVSELASYLLQLERDCHRDPTFEYSTIGDIPNFLPTPVMRWYMFLAREEWEEDRLFEARWRYPLNTIRLTANGYIWVPKNTPGIAVSWGWVGIFEVPQNNLTKVFWEVPDMIVSIELSPLIGCPNAPITVYFYNFYSTAAPHVQKMMNYIWFQEQLTLNLGTWMMVTKNGLRYSRDGDPRDTQSNGYGITTPLYGLKQYCSDRRIIELLDSSDYDLVKAITAVDRATEVYWNAIRTHMDKPFLWYDWDNGKVLPLLVERENEYFFENKAVKWWRTRVFPEVPVPYFPGITPTTIEESEKKVHEAKVSLGLIEDTHGTPNEVDDNTAMQPNVDPETLDIVENNSDGWYDRLRDVIGSQFPRYNNTFPAEPTIFFARIKEWLKAEQASGDVKEKIKLDESQLKDKDRDLKQLKADKAALEERIKTFETENTRLTTELSTDRVDNSRLTAENGRVSKLCEEHTRALTANHREIEHLRSTLQGLYAQVMTVTNTTVTQLTQRVTASAAGPPVTATPAQTPPLQTTNATATETRTRTATETQTTQGATNPPETPPLIGAQGRPQQPRPRTNIPQLPPPPPDN